MSRRLLRVPGLLLALWAGLAGCRTATAARPAAPAPRAFRPDKLAEMDRAVERALAQGRAPGGVLWLEREGASYHRAYGRRAVLPAPEPMTEDTIFDAASLTKVIATTPAIMKLYEQGRLRFDDPVAKYIPEFAQNGKEAVTIRHLMTHTSAMPSGLPLREPWTGRDAAIRLACDRKLQGRPGEVFRYSDVNFITLGEVVRRVSGESLATFVAREVYAPLGMKDTGYLPSASLRARIAPTEKTDEGVLRAVVHDPTARRMGGVAGHAGVFTTAADLARFARMMLAGGAQGGVRVFAPATVALMTSVQSPATVPERRGLGWDIDTAYSGPGGRHFPLGSYGHSGWTGTSLWIDPFSRTFLVFLSNRNHPTEAGNVLALRYQLATLAAEAIEGFDFSHVPGALPPGPRTERLAPATAAGAAGGAPAAAVLAGIDVLERDGFAPLEGLRIGLITNHTGQDRKRNATIDLLREARDVRLVALFSPEHGIRGVEDSHVGDSVDARTGLPVYSLYGAHWAPTPEQMKGLDALVYDIQDIGCRFYTYETTLGMSLEAAGKARVRVFVLDRPNPIGGLAIEGPVMTAASHFVGFHPVPLRHGMTVGELAQMFNEERGFHAQLNVIQVEGWRRAQWFDETGLPWTHPSPNMRSLAGAALYPGVGLLESAISVGRGTDSPFELVGAPYVDDVRLAAELERLDLPGVRFMPVRFTPTTSTFKDRACGGVRIHLVDRRRYDAVNVGLAVATTLRRLYPQDFAQREIDKMDRLLGDKPTLDAIRAGRSLDDIRRLWDAGLAEFRARRERYLIYK